MRSTIEAVVRTPHGAVATLLVAALLWGSAFPAIKAGYVLLGAAPEDTGTVLVFAAIRFFLAGAVLLGGAALCRIPFRLNRALAAKLVALGLIQTTIQYATFYVGIAHTTAVKASIVVASGSFFLAFLSPFVYRNDRLSVPRLLGLVLGFCGVVLANLVRARGALGVEWLGDSLILGTGICSACASLLSKRLLQQAHPVVVNGVQVLAGAVVLLGATLVLTPVTMPPRITLPLAGVTLYLAVVTAVAFTLYYQVIKHHDLTKVATYRFLIPLCGVVLSALFVPGEGMSWPLLIAAALVVAGVWVVNRPPKKAQQKGGESRSSK